MKIHARASVLMVSISCLVTPLLAAATVADQRVEAACLLALGRKPTAAESAEWSSQAEKATVSELVAKQRARLQENESLRQEVARKAFSDAVGTGAKSAQDLGAGGNRVYFEMMQEHIARLEQNPAEYRAVLDRAYRRVVRRPVYEEEVGYWNKFDVLPYVLVVGAVDDWGRRNQPGLMVTTGTPTVSLNSVYLATARLSPAVAEEARAAIDAPRANTDYFHYGSSRTVIAPGAEKLVAGGRIHFAAAGAPGVVAE